MVIDLLPPLLRALFFSADVQFSWLALPHFIVALVIAVTGALIWHWEKGSRIGRVFAAFSSIFAVWVAGRGMVQLLTQEEMVVLVSRNLFAIAAVALPIALTAISVMLHNERERRAFIISNWVIAVVFVLVAVNTPWLVSSAKRYSWGLEPLFGPAGYAFMLWILVLVIVATSDYVRCYRAASAGGSERQRLKWFGAALLSLYLAAVQFLCSMGIPVYPLGGLAVLGFTLLMAYITQRFGLVEVSVEMAASQIAGMVRGALVVVDSEGVVKLFSERAETLLGLHRRMVIGQSAAAFLGDSFSVHRLNVVAVRQMGDEEADLLYLHPQTAQNLELALSVKVVYDHKQREAAFVCVLRDLTSLKRAEQLRLQERITDPLTALPNRAMFLGQLDAAAQRCKREPDYGYSVCFIGMDRMRVINEDLGYQAGDQVLRELGQRLLRAMRPQDAAARIGGDEFGVLIRSASEAEVNSHVSQLRAQLLAPLKVAGEELFLSASMGLISSGGDYASGAEVLRAASIAMYRAKEAASGGVHVLEGGEIPQQRLRLEAELHHAVEQEEFRAYYQPVVDTLERKLVGFEALVRWQHPQRGLVMPGDFLEAAGELGLMENIDSQMLRQVCEDLEQLQRWGGPGVGISINLGEECLRQATLLEQVRELLVRHHLSASTLRVEVLERIAQIERAQETLEGLRDLGLGLYIDDFGTGYSSFSRLHRLPVTTLKIDREFVRGMALGRGGDKVVNSIIALARSLELEVIAEGVSSAEEAARLRDAGCRYMQGFYFSRAVPFDEAAEMVRDPRLFLAQYIQADQLRSTVTLEPVLLAANS